MSDDGCMCDFHSTCGGLGILLCQGCGGDICVCTCGGEAECYGCADCAYGDEDYPEYESALLASEKE